MSCNEDIKRLKGSLTLDFNQRPSQAKRIKCQLTTPDVEKLALTTPEVAELLSKNLPANGSLPTFTRNGTNEFDEEKPSKQALEMWTNQIPSTIINNNNNNNANSTINFSSNNNNNKLIKIENDIDNSNNNDNIPSLVIDTQPINMEDQEMAKLERKRLRNRIAASRCRQRKLERISNLQKQVDDYKSKCDDLNKWMIMLKDVNTEIYHHISKHKELGCDL